jgi:hypothetical protein
MEQEKKHEEKDFNNVNYVKLNKLEGGTNDKK